MNKLLEGFQSLNRQHIPKMDFHMHTTWTDGKNTAQEMHQAAIDCGLEHILFSEHGRKTSGDWFPNFADEIRSLPTDQCKAYVGLEAKVDNLEGDLDASDGMIEVCDLVMGSVHRMPHKDGFEGFKRMAKDEALELEYKLSMAVLDHPKIDILGHPFGTSIKGFKAEPTEKMYRDVARKAAQKGVAFEINNQYHSDVWWLVDICQQENTPIALGSNAHAVAEVGGIMRALKKGL